LGTPQFEREVGFGLALSERVSILRTFLILAGNKNREALMEIPDNDSRI